MRRTTQAERVDVYTRITAEIIAAIEAGAGDWRMPWHHDGAAVTRPENIASSRRYRGVNVLALWIAAQAYGYSSGVWGTYRQWLAVGAQVRKGERGTTVVLWKQAASPADDDHDDGDQRGRRRGPRALGVLRRLLWRETEWWTMAETTFDVLVAADGRVVLRATVRSALGLRGETRITVSLEEGQVAIRGIPERVKGAQELYHTHATKGRPVDAFLNDRKAWKQV